MSELSQSLKDLKNREKQQNDKRVLRWIWHVSGKAKWDVLWLTILEAVSGSIGIFSALILRAIVDSATNGDKEAFIRNALLFVGYMLVSLLLYSLERYFSEHASASILNNFRLRLFSCLMHKDYAEVTAVHTGEWMNRLTSDTSVVTNGVVDIVPVAAGMIARLISAFTTLVVLVPVLGLVLLPGAGLMLLITIKLRPLLKGLFKRIQEADGRLHVLMQERLESMLVIRAFSQEKQTVKDAQNRMGDHMKERMNRNKFSILCYGGFSFAMQSLTVLGAIVCGYGILQGHVSFGDFTAAMQLINQVKAPFFNISGLIPEYFSMLASAERLMIAENFDDADLPDEECNAVDQGNAAPEENNHANAFTEFTEFRTDYPDIPPFEKIGLENISFKYKPVAEGDNETPAMPSVLEGFNLEINKGDYVAFVGPSGCGKSTVLKILMCLYPLDAGERFLITDEGKKPLKDYNHGLYAYVPQGNQLISGTIREIVTFGNADAMKKDEEIWKAIEIACAKEFVEKLANGIDTQLGEHGAGLSEGQMQRIALARAVFSSHPVLLLDEATSSLDEATEAKLLDNLRKMTDKTVIIVTHRPAVLNITDKVVDFGEYLQEA